MTTPFDNTEKKKKIDVPWRRHRWIMEHIIEYDPSLKRRLRTRLLRTVVVANTAILQVISFTGTYIYYRKSLMLYVFVDIRKLQLKRYIFPSPVVTIVNYIKHEVFRPSSHLWRKVSPSAISE